MESGLFRFVDFYASQGGNRGHSSKTHSELPTDGASTQARGVDDHHEEPSRSLPHSNSYNRPLATLHGEACRVLRLPASAISSVELFPWLRQSISQRPNGSTARREVDRLRSLRISDVTEGSASTATNSTIPSLLSMEGIDNGVEQRRKVGAIPEEASREELAAFLWRPFTLSFDAPEEEQFREASYGATQHIVAHAAGLVGGWIILFAVCDAAMVWCMVLWMLMPSLHYACFSHRLPGDRLRMPRMDFLRKTIGLRETGSYLWVTESTVGQAMNVVLTKLQLVRLFCLPPASFRHRFVVHSVVFGLTLFWIVPFCERCPEDSSACEQIGFVVDGLFSYGILGKVPDRVAYPCWMISAALLTITGYILPVFFVYVAEVVARSAFAKTKTKSIFHSSIEDYAATALRVATLAALSSSIFVWFLLSHLRNLLN